MSELCKKVIDHIIEVEGGYVNDPRDSGGETMFGITVEVARKYGWTGPMNQLPRELAFKIYKEWYWDELCLDDIEKLSPGIAAELADTGVNMGVGRAAEFLQRCLNVFNNQQQYYPDINVDRDIGPTTVRTFRSYMETRKESVMLKALNCLQGAFYIELAEKREKDEAWLTGWYDNRVEIPHF